MSACVCGEIQGVRVRGRAHDVHAFLFVLQANPHMCECMRVCFYIYVCIYTYMHTYSHVCSYVHVYDCVFTCLCACKWVALHVCAASDTCLYFRENTTACFPAEHPLTKDNQHDEKLGSNTHTHI